MQSPPPDKQASPPAAERPSLRGWHLTILIMLALSLILITYTSTIGPQRSVISLTYLEQLIQGNDSLGQPLLDAEGQPVGPNVLEITLEDRRAEGLFRVEPPPEMRFDARGERIDPEPGERLRRHFRVNIPQPDAPDRARLTQLLREYNVRIVDAGPPTNWTGIYTIMMILVTVALFLLIFGMFRRAQSQMMGGGGFLSNFSRSPAKRYEPTQRQITFADVAGLEGVKADLQEVVEFLKEPEKFQRLGGRVPKGVLLIGPPGTGKTLLARAIAGEANVPFFSVNGAEFIQMFVGVGASRVRDLFTTAKSQSPAIIFIDEIDAVGRQRGAGLGGGHDEREQTLNQILGEMDGFQANDSVIIVAATNRPDVLDPALLRPGRFDRHITVSRPTQKGRMEILKVHVRDVPLADDVDLKQIAASTVGMTGADLQNLVNEAALWAARQNKSKVEMIDFYVAKDKILMGAKREEVLTEKEKERTAYHEAGHTLAAWYRPGANPVHKVTIIPRGQALGTTQMLPEEDQMNISQTELQDHLIVLMAGRAAEQLVFSELTVGAERDLEQATSLARRMVTHWGMSDRIGPVSYKMTDEDPFLGREIHQNRHFSERTMVIIDEEVGRILQHAAQQASGLLETHRRDLDAIATGLLEQEELTRDDIRKLIGPSVREATPTHPPGGAAAGVPGEAAARSNTMR